MKIENLSTPLLVVPSSATHPDTRHRWWAFVVFQLSKHPHRAVVRLSVLSYVGLLIKIQINSIILKTNLSYDAGVSSWRSESTKMRKIIFRLEDSCRIFVGYEVHEPCFGRGMFKLLSARQPVAVIIVSLHPQSNAALSNNVYRLIFPMIECEIIFSLPSLLGPAKAIKREEEKRQTAEKMRCDDRRNDLTEMIAGEYTNEFHFSF